VRDEVQAVQAAADKWNAEVALRWAFDRLGDKVALVSAFGAEGMVLIDMAASIQRRFRLITIDTGFLFSETHTLMAEVEERYGVTIEKVHPALSPAEQEQVHGASLWKRDPDLCCGLRKVEPLRHKLAAWSKSIPWRTGAPRRFGITSVRTTCPTTSSTSVVIPASGVTTAHVPSCWVKRSGAGGGRASRKPSAACILRDEIPFL
jgi:phosphoadenosine phosphosulfate reductase